MKKDRKYTAEQFQRMVELIDILRGENGCPWDKRQTLENTKGYILEETYELIEAIMENDTAKIKEELADVLFQCVFIGRILEDDHQESLSEIIDANIKKMVQRHPHVFDDADFKSEQELLENWEFTKKKDNKSIFSNLIKNLPSLSLAQKVQEKASRIGFDWENAEGPIAKIKEELDEFITITQKNGNDRDLEDEFGDILFSLVNLSRFFDIDAELSLRRSINKFIHRFKNMEILINKDKKQLNEMSQNEMDEYWESSKKIIENKH